MVDKGCRHRAFPVCCRSDARCRRKRRQGYSASSPPVSAKLATTPRRGNCPKSTHDNGMRIIGPNIIGVLSNSDKMNASFYNYLPYEGKAALISQSGALLIAMAAATYTRRVGFDKMISIWKPGGPRFRRPDSHT